MPKRGVVSMAASAEPVDLLAALATVSEFWSAKVVARVNDQYVKVAKLRGHR